MRDRHDGQLLATRLEAQVRSAAPIGRVRGPNGLDFTIGNGGPGIQTQELRAALVDIQRGDAPDPHNWVERIF